MLHEFVTLNRTEIIRRCKAKASNRYKPAKIPSVINHGVPLFLEQLVTALLLSEVNGGLITIESDELPKLSEVRRSASIHGAELLRTGYTITQVVHDYGDVCQSITEMALEQKIAISTQDFRVLNSNLDDAIAESVNVYESGVYDAQLSKDLNSLNLRQNNTLEQLRYINMGLRAHEAIKTANIGLSGATGSLLIFALQELQKLAEKELAEIRVLLTDTKTIQVGVSVKAT